MNFQEQWDTAVGLAEVRGWRVGAEFGADGMVVVRCSFNHLLAFGHVFEKTEGGLFQLVKLLSQPDEIYKVYSRYSFGWADPRGLYGTTTC